MGELVAENLTLGYGGREIVSRLNVTVLRGTVTGIVGPNGCGKSTLLRGFSRLLTPGSGRVILDGAELSSFSARNLARRLGLLPQMPITPDAMTVAELVGLGRHPHRALLGGWTASDIEAIDDAMRLTDVADLATHRVDRLSGGQRQRVWIATVLAQRTDTLLLDEPISFLDIARCVEILDLITNLNQALGTTVCMVLHDLNLAARYCHRLIAMRDGEVIAVGTPEDVVTDELVKRVFGIEARVIADPVSQSPLVIPVGCRRLVEQQNQVGE